MSGATFYAGLRQTALRLLGDKGRPMTLHQRTPGAYDPSTGISAVSDTDYPCVGAEFDYAALLIDGTNIQRGDKKIILVMTDSAIVPDVGDELTGTARRNVIAAKAYAPSGVIVAWQLQVRR